MDVLRQMKQRELNLGPVADVVPSHSFETFIGKRGDVLEKLNDFFFCAI